MQKSNRNALYTPRLSGGAMVSPVAQQKKAGREDRLAGGARKRANQKLWRTPAANDLKSVA